jgi:UDP-glucose 4-epimerase
LTEPTTLRRAVVTGARGFIGQPLARLLRSEGFEVVGVDRNPGPTVDLVADLRQPDALSGVLDASTVLFHLAGAANVRASVASPVADFEDNLLTAIQVLETARAAQCRMVFPSTGSVYDPKAPLPLIETAPIGPRSPYAAAKLAVEAYCHAYHLSYGLDVRIARIFSVVGPGMGRFAIHDFVERLREDPHELVLWGDGSQTRDYLSVEDVARGLVLIAGAGSPGEVYNLASGSSRSMRDVADAVVGALGLDDCEVRTDGRTSQSEAYRMEADVSKIRGLGFKPKCTFEESLGATVAWLESSEAEATQA